MIRITEKKTTAVLYESIFDFDKVDDIKDSSNKELFQSITEPSRDDFGKQGDLTNWLGAPTLSEFNNRLQKGWNEGVEKIQKIATKEINPMSLRRRKIKADQGNDLDIHAVYRGDLSRAWTKTKKQAKAGTTRSVSLICNLSCSHSVTSEKLFWRGASVLKLADVLIQAGYNVSIYGAAGTDCYSKRKLFQFIEIKAEDQPLDISNLASLVAMPGFKRIKFHGGNVSEADRLNEICPSGLGTPINNYDHAISMLPISQNYFTQGDINDKASAETWIDQVMAKIESQEVQA